MSFRSVQGLIVAAAAVALAGCHGGPEVTEASPSTISARGGETLTLRGSGFEDGATVLLGEARVAAKVTSGVEIHVTTPPLYAGPLAVHVEEGGQTAALHGGVTVTPLDLAFDEAPPYAFATDPMTTVTGVALGDFDSDGDPDVITCAAGAPCRFLENDGRGNFTDAPESKGHARFPDGMPDTHVVVAADLDGDGDLDLFLGTGTGAPGVVLRNDGHGVFADAGVAALPADGDAASAAVAADLDGDGLPELIVANTVADMVPLRVYRNTGKGKSLVFGAAAAGAVPARDWAVTALAVLDADGDGVPDLVLATPGASDGASLRLLLGAKDGFHEAPGRLPNGTAPAAFAAGDVDGDGDVDLVAVGAGQDRLLLNDGSGHFFDATTGAMPVDAVTGTSVALVDLDRDRHLDLVIGNAGAETRLYLNDGAGRFFDHTPLLPIRADATVWVGAADVDGDADMDLLIVNGPPDPARLYLSVEPPHAP